MKIGKRYSLGQSPKVTAHAVEWRGEFSSWLDRISRGTVCEKFGISAYKTYERLPKIPLEKARYPARLKECKLVTLRNVNFRHLASAVRADLGFARSQ